VTANSQTNKPFGIVNEIPATDAPIKSFRVMLLR